MKNYSFTITLTEPQIAASLENIKTGLTKYQAIQQRFEELNGKPLDANFQKKFNGYYRIIKKPTIWYNTFYKVFEESREIEVDYPIILKALHDTTGRYEASFASKLLATLNPFMPVIDSFVLKNLNTRLPYYNDPNRFLNICKLHQAIGHCYNDYLQSKAGKYLVGQFQKAYPQAIISEVKMIDFVLWQSRL